MLKYTKKRHKGKLSKFKTLNTYVSATKTTCLVYVCIAVVAMTGNVEKTYAN